MQTKNEKFYLTHIPEHYLHWTYERRDLLLPKLFTYENYPLEILDIGQPNFDNGPDYLNATLRINGEMVRGDVEFHLNWHDWYRHGHAYDRRYNQVILHVLWCLSQDIPRNLKQRFSHFIISQYLNISADHWIQKMTYFDHELSLREINGHSILLTKSEAENLAWKRFNRKCDEVRSWIKHYGWENSLYMGLAKVLGYNKNSDPFVALIQQLPPSKLLDHISPIQRSPVVFWILLAWQGGLLDRPFRRGLNLLHPIIYRVIFHICQQYPQIFSIQRQSIINWNFSRLRPNNNPYIRLAGFSQLLFQFQQQSLFKQMLDIFMSRQPLKSILSSIEKVLCIPLSADLRRLLKETLNFQKVPMRTIGKERCYLFILNILIPICYVWANSNENPGFSMFLEDMYFKFPVVDNNKIVRNFVSNHLKIYKEKAFFRQAILEYYFQKVGCT